MRATRILVGAPDAVPAFGALLALALQLRDHAIASGLVPRAMRASRIRCSRSQHLTFADRLGREWIVRVSNHHKPRCTGHTEPHVDLVSRDGVSGLQEARRILSRIAAGDQPWWPPVCSPKRKGQR